VESPEDAKGKQVIVGIGIRGDANTVIGYRPPADPITDPAVSNPTDGGEMADLTWA
jgi:hypothetical protein